MERKVLVDAVELYENLPAAIHFRAQTGYGLVVERGIDKVGKITPALGEPDVVRGRKGRIIEILPPSGIWKPMQVFVTGGERSGWQTITAVDIKSAVEKFAANPDWSVLRVTTGKGLKIENNIPKLVDISKAETQILFELTHYGGRSIVPILQVVLGKAQDATNLKWESGFIYQSAGNKPVMAEENLHLSRVLAEWDYGSDENLARVWADIEKEAQRLTFLHLSDQLPKVIEEPRGRIHVFFSQGLTRLLPSVRIDQKFGYDYEVRNDGVVIVKRTIRPWELADGSKFASVFENFTTECSRIYFQFCQSLSDAQKQKLGKPGDDESSELVKTAEISFERDSQRSTDQSETLIAWRERCGAPHFPYEGWNPEKGKKYYGFCHKWGKGYRVSPASPQYCEETHQKDTDTAEVGLTRVEYDDREKFLGGREVKLETKEEFREGSWWTDRLEFLGEGQGLIYQTKTNQTIFFRQFVTDGKIDWHRDEGKYPIVVKHNRSFPATEFYIQPQESSYQSRDEGLRALNPASWKGWWDTYGIGVDPEGKKTKAYPKKSDHCQKYHIYSWGWSETPEWLQKRHLDANPICSCGRERHQISPQKKELEIRIRDFYSKKKEEVLWGDWEDFVCCVHATLEGFN